MKVGRYHLTYCLNVHPGISLDEVRANIVQYVVPLKASLSSSSPFGVGLRLAGAASVEMLEGNNLAEFKALLDEHDLYVFTLNGFPYGPFHGTSVKADVHVPHWDDPERFEYTRRLIEALAILLPDGVDGGISTNPFGYRPAISSDTASALATFTDRLTDLAILLHELAEKTAKHIHVDIEPEPDGLLGNCAELIEFFKTPLIPVGSEKIARQLGIAENDAREVLLRHIQVCFDTCHSAVSYESPVDVLAEFEKLGIQVGKIQISSAVQLDLEPTREGREHQMAAVGEFDEPVYLHQVIQRNNDGTLVSFTDLPEALGHIDDSDAAEWRIHFHVPIFLDHFGQLGSTQETIRQTFDVLKDRQFTNHLEIETYTWDVLPADLKLPIDQSIEREYRWVLDAIR